MLGKDTMETASTEVTSIQRRNLFREIIDTLSILKVESTSNICYNFQVNFPSKLMKVPRGCVHWAEQKMFENDRMKKQEK